MDKNSECRQKKYLYRDVVKLLEEQVVRHVQETSLPVSNLIENRPQEKIDKDELYEKMEGIKTRKISLYEEYREGKYSRDEFKAKNALLQSKIEELQSQIDGIQEDVRLLSDEDCDRTEIEWTTFNLKNYQQIIDRVVVKGNDDIDVIWK